jgi:hypothetical protein
MLYASTLKRWWFFGRGRRLRLGQGSSNERGRYAVFASAGSPVVASSTIQVFTYSTIQLDVNLAWLYVLPRLATARARQAREGTR